MSEIRLHVMCGKKRRSASSFLTPTIREGSFIVGELVAIKGENGIVAAQTSRGLELFDIRLTGGAWFVAHEGRICLDLTLPFPRANVTPPDLICFERPIDAIDRIVRWGFAVDLAHETGVLCGCGNEAIEALIDRVPEFRSLLVAEDGSYTPEGPSEAWNEILIGRMCRAYRQPA